MKTYNELIRYTSFDDRVKYLQIKQGVGYETFGPYRYINQRFYQSSEWKQFRSYIITRDKSCDLGLEGYDIYRSKDILIHHINPITVDDLLNRNTNILDPNNVVSVSRETHNLIHYGFSINKALSGNRTPLDTKLW